MAFLMFRSRLVGGKLEQKAHTIEQRGDVPFAQALRFWLKLGFISFGGPAGQISILHEELVVRRRWISENRFLHALNYCMLLPGPEAQQLATYMGWLLHRTWGGIVAGTLFVLPSLVILIALAWVYLTYGDQPLVAGLFDGVKPAVVAIVLQATWRIGKRTLHNGLLWAIAVCSFLSIAVAGLPFPAIVGGAALIGLIGGRVAPALLSGSTGHGGGIDGEDSALIGDASAQLEHTRFRWGRTVIVSAVGVAAWTLPMLGLWLNYGWEGTFTQMAWFFTKAAFLTIGGAYAVLPYVFQGAVEHYGWLSAAQMIDGLALGETTPGPLIMVVAFVGFVGGHAISVLGEGNAVLSGIVAAALVTWFTFLPSFLFILIGGPLVESSRHQLGLSAPLTAITAAIVGVILNLALFFGYHVIWPEGFAGSFDLVAALMAVGAAVALLRFDRGVLEVIGVCAAIGLVVSLF